MPRRGAQEAPETRSVTLSDIPAIHRPRAFLVPRRGSRKARAATMEPCMSGYDRMALALEVHRVSRASVYRHRSPLEQRSASRIAVGIFPRRVRLPHGCGAGTRQGPTPITRGRGERHRYTVNNRKP